MSRTSLKLYTEPETASQPDRPQPMVTVTLAEVLPLLADAFESRRLWLRDFEHDPVTISSDLYEVLMAYRYYRRPSA